MRDTLLYSDAIFGIRGSTGGTLVELSRDSAWSVLIDPVYSDFPSENDQWPERAETLSVRWDSTRAHLIRRTADSAPQDLGDSLTLEMACDTARLLRRRGATLDTVLLERRLQRRY